MDYYDSTIQTSESSDSETLKGFPRAAGRIEGKVRVLMNPEDGEMLEPGEILVATTTNVGWTSHGLFDPATKGMLPQLVDKEELTQHNSLVVSARSASVLLGPVIGAALYANFGVTLVFFVNGILFLLFGTSEMIIRYTHIKQKATEGVKGMMNDLLEGVKFVLQNYIIRKLSFFLLISYFVIQPIFSVILPLFFKESLLYSDAQYGYLQTIIILGSLIGSILVGYLFGKEVRMSKPLVIGCSILLSLMFMFSILLFPTSLYTLVNDTTIYFILLASVLCLFSAVICLSPFQYSLLYNKLHQTNICPVSFHWLI